MLQTPNTLVANNAVYVDVISDNYTFGINLYSGGPESFAGSQILHNTVVMKRQVTGTSSGSALQVWATGSSGVASVANNILAVHDTSNYLINLTADTGSIGYLGHNLIYRHDGTNANFSIFWESTNYSDLATLNALANAENNISMDPLFEMVDISSPTPSIDYSFWFRCSPSSPYEARSLASTAYLTTVPQDIQGAPRTAPVSMGAYQNPLYAIGDTGPAGGWIFYENMNWEMDGWRYLEVAPGSEAYYGIPWSDTNGEVGTSTLMGSGLQNTQDIISWMTSNSSLTQTEYAAGWAMNFVYNGYSDWFLPSLEELQQLYTNYAYTVTGIFSDSANDYYWSSSEDSGLPSSQAMYKNLMQGDGWESADNKTRTTNVFPSGASSSPEQAAHREPPALAP